MIETARPDDIAAIVRLEQLCQGADAWSEGLVRDGVTRGLPTVRHLVARDGDVVGYAVVSVAGDVVELQRIGVDPAHRREGRATTLVGAVLDLASAEGAERVLLEVREDNPEAMAFYGVSGFDEIARRPRYYRDGAAAVIMARPVRA